MTQWYVRGLKSETRQAIAKQAQALGCTIAQLLEQTFGPDSLTVIQGKLEPRHSWLLHGIRSSTKYGLKAQAVKAGLSISDYLTDLVNKAGKAQASNDDLIEEITALIKGR